LQNRGQVLSREIILDRLFDGSGNYVDDNTLSVYVKRLREKLGDTDRDKPYIKTIRGIGYVMNP
jgi:DNA-binding response OmpR family regulator